MKLFLFYSSEISKNYEVTNETVTLRTEKELKNNPIFKSFKLPALKKSICMYSYTTDNGIIMNGILTRIK